MPMLVSSSSREPLALAVLARTTHLSRDKHVTCHVVIMSSSLPTPGTLPAATSYVYPRHHRFSGPRRTGTVKATSVKPHPRVLGQVPPEHAADLPWEPGTKPGRPEVKLRLESSGQGADHPGRDRVDAGRGLVLVVRAVRTVGLGRDQYRDPADLAEVRCPRVVRARGTCRRARRYRRPPRARAGRTRSCLIPQPSSSVDRYVRARTVRDASWRVVRGEKLSQCGRRGRPPC
jgi:hypothetical protein